MLDLERLRHALLQGFVLGDQHCRWGATLEEVSRRTGIGEHRLGGLRVAVCRHLGDLAVCDATAVSPHRARPVVNVSYSLIGATDGEAVVRIVEDLSAELGVPITTENALHPGSPASGGVARTASWRVGHVDCTLSVYGGPRDSSSGRVIAGLYLNHDHAILARAYLAQFEARGADWHQARGHAEVVRVPGLRSPDHGSSLDASEYLALFSPHMRRPPDWLVEDLKSDEVALWSHSSGWHGITGREGGWAFRSPRLSFRLVRMHAARGPGFALLDTGDGEKLFTSGPGAEGFDELVARLEKHGHRVAVIEDHDA